MSSKKVRVGMIGMGGIAYMHEAGYTDPGDYSEIVAVCDVNEKLAWDRAIPYAAIAYSDYRALIADRSVDLVDITVPHHLHYPIALAALQHGKHVLVEKPMAMKPEQARHLIETARSMGVKFTVAENTHFVEAYREAERMLSSRVLGDIRFVRTYIAGTEAVRIKNAASWVGSTENSGVLLDSG